MVAVPGGSRGRLLWELVDATTAEVHRGQRDLHLSDFEVIVSPPPTPPQVRLLHPRPRQLFTDSLGWLLRAGRGSSAKSVRLADGFWVVLRELRTPSRSSLVLLSAKRDHQRLSCSDRFRVDEDGSTATQTDDTGRLTLEWTRDGDGFQELAGTTAATDVTLHLRSPGGPLGRGPLWQLRLLAGTAIRWPSAADGTRLVPRLRPGRGRPADDT